jgi:gamma-glutamyltranspeptidase/glutathione hydrolase
MVPESGIVLNDAMDDFSVEGRTNAFGYLPTPSNYSTLSFCYFQPHQSGSLLTDSTWTLSVEGNKRPLSSMTPYFIEDPNGDFLFAGSCAGSSSCIFMSSFFFPPLSSPFGLRP